MNAVGVGSLNLDLIFEVDRSAIDDLGLKPGGEMFGTSEEFSELLSKLEERGRLVGRTGGGSAANVVFALNGMGFRTGMVGVVGEDENGDFIIESMSGVDTSRVRRDDATGMCISIIAEEDRSLLVLPNSNDLFASAPCDLEYLRRAKVVHLTSFAGRDPLLAQVRIARDLEEEVMVSLDPGELYARRGLDAIRPLIERADIIFPSDLEIRMLTGMDPIRGSKKLLRMGPDIVVCTMGGRGASIFTPEGSVEISPRKVMPVDKTGAGDVFAASFLAGILRGWALERCGEFAAMASAQSIACYGRSGYPDREMLESFDGGG
jgi:ribokinase